MDFEHQDDHQEPHNEQRAPYPPLNQPSSGFAQPLSGPPVAMPRRRTSGWRILWWFLFVFSIIGNIMMFLVLMGTVAFFAVGSPRGMFNEDVIQAGSRSSKIVVVSLQGIIDDRQARQVQEQLKMARADSTVKGLIIKTDSPGGTISASDQIHRAIKKFREDEQKPCIAFMQGVAASGGYYTSVACDKILAEPTIITGSIGVILSHFVFEDLLQNKLGVQPVVIKSGERKDWPSSYSKPSDEQLQYLENSVMTPAFERFLEVVTEGRKDTLTPEEVRDLADGSVFSAKEAHAKGLGDQIVYLDDAIGLVQSLAGVSGAQVVEYQQVLSLSSILGARTQAHRKIDRNTLHELSALQVLYLWSAS